MSNIGIFLKQLKEYGNSSFFIEADDPNTAIQFIIDMDDEKNTFSSYTYVYDQNFIKDGMVNKDATVIETYENFKSDNFNSMYDIVCYLVDTTLFTELLTPLFVSEKREKKENSKLYFEIYRSIVNSLDLDKRHLYRLTNRSYEERMNIYKDRIIKGDKWYIENPSLSYIEKIVNDHIEKIDTILDYEELIIETKDKDLKEFYGGALADYCEITIRGYNDVNVRSKGRIIN